MVGRGWSWLVVVGRCWSLLVVVGRCCSLLLALLGWLLGSRNADPQNGLLIFFGKETHSETKSWKIVEDFNEQSYNNQRETLEIVYDFASEAKISSIFFMFLHFSSGFSIFLQVFLIFLHFFFIFTFFFILFFLFFLFFSYFHFPFSFFSFFVLFPFFIFFQLMLFFFFMICFHVFFCFPIFLCSVFSCVILFFLLSFITCFSICFLSFFPFNFFNFFLFLFLGCSKSDFFGLNCFTISVDISKNNNSFEQSRRRVKSITPLRPLFFFSLFSCFSFFHFPNFPCFFLKNVFFLSSSFPKKMPLLAFISRFNKRCSLRSRCSRKMCCLVDFLIFSFSSLFFIFFILFHFSFFFLSFSFIFFFFFFFSFFFLFSFFQFLRESGTCETDCKVSCALFVLSHSRSALQLSRLRSVAGARVQAVKLLSGEQHAD